MLHAPVNRANLRRWFFRFGRTIPPCLSKGIRIVNIFISVAAYRDPELAPTLRDCIARARYPAALRFGICWQHGEQETAPAEFADARMHVIAAPWRESGGACWARAEIMKLWDGEQFFLQIDSHHRFVQDWDARLLRQAERSGAAKPILSTYGAPYDPAADPPAAGEPMQMNFDSFTHDGIPMFRPYVIPDWAGFERPLRARFVSAHFLFTLGSFVTEVPYDPELYFHGEEITLSIRAFTHGYELFHPPEPILWHEYTRAHRSKHWDDHVRAHGVKREWHECDGASREKVRRFLTAPQVGPFGCGTKRSFDEYEAYAGLSFRHRAVQDATLHGKEPPNAPAPPDWPTQVREWRMRVVMERAGLPEAALRDPLLWYVGFHDAADREIYREDAQGEELCGLIAGDSSQIVIERHFRSERRPVTWTVWPMNAAGEWLDKIMAPAGSGR
jgi:hypothetical protein